MINIPPLSPEQVPSPKRPEGAGVQPVPAVLSDKPGLNPGVVLNMPTPVMDTPADQMRPRDATAQPSATQIDSARPASSSGAAVARDADVQVRPGLNTQGLPERLAKLLVQLEKLADKPGVPVMWPVSEQLKAARPEVALLNLRRALGESMLFEVRRLGARLLPSAVGPSATSVSGWVRAEGRDQARVVAGALFAGDEISDLPVDSPLPELSRLPLDRRADPASPRPLERGDNPLVEQPTTKVEAEVDRRSTKSTDSPRIRSEAGNADSDEAVPETSAQQGFTRQGETLDADSPSIRDAIRLLLNGELRWQGELSPGVFARIDREDVWEEDPRAPGAVVKGTMVSLDLNLPHLGQVKVRGMFIRDEVRISVLPDKAARGAMQSEFEALRARLAARGLEGAQVRLTEADHG